VFGATRVAGKITGMKASIESLPGNPAVNFSTKNSTIQECYTISGLGQYCHFIVSGLRDYEQSVE
jgi:hypothetical protein